MEIIEQTVEDYLEDDGVRVIKTVRTSRIKANFEIVDSDNWTKFERSFMNKHNEYRKMHQVPPLQLSRVVFI